MTNTNTPLTDQQSVDNFNEMELQNRILRLRSMMTVIGQNAENAIVKRPENVSQEVWMAAALGDIFRMCLTTLAEDTAASGNIPTTYTEGDQQNG